MGWPGGTASGADAFADRSRVALRCSCLLDSLARHCSLPALPSPPSHPPDIHVLPVRRMSPLSSPAASSHPPSYLQIRRKLVIVGDGTHPSSSVLHSSRPHPPWLVKAHAARRPCSAPLRSESFPKNTSVPSLHSTPLSPVPVPDLTLFFFLATESVHPPPSVLYHL